MYSFAQGTFWKSTSVNSLVRCPGFFKVETRFFTASFQGAPQILVSKPPFWLPAQACRQSLGATGVLQPPSHMAPQSHVVLLGARKMLPEWGPLGFFSRNSIRIWWTEGETILEEVSGSEAPLPRKIGSKCCKLGEVQWVKHQQNLAPGKKSTHACHHIMQWIANKRRLETKFQVHLALAVPDHDQRLGNAQPCMASMRELVMMVFWAIWHLKEAERKMGYLQLNQPRVAAGERLGHG